MQPTVSTVFAGVLSRLTAWDDLGDVCFSRLQGEPEARNLAEGVPHSRRNPWQPQAVLSENH